MTKLQLRKQTLLLESALNRLTLYAECKHWRETANCAGRMKSLRRQIGVVLALGLRRSPAGGFLARALAATPPLMELWRTCVAPANEPK